MALADDIRPLLKAAMLLGSAPHVVTEDDILVTTPGTVFTVACLIVHLGTCVFGMHAIIDAVVPDPRMVVLTAVRTALSYVCLFTDTVLTVLWNDRLRSALAQLRSFDRATRREGEHRDARGTRRRCWAVVLTVLTFWTVVGGVTYYCETTTKLFNALTYGIVNATLSFQMLKFTGFVFFLYQRFCRLCEIVLVPEVHKIVVLDHARPALRLQEIWWLHCCLANATETVNSVYAVQLLLWISSTSFNILSRLYTINEGAATPALLQVRDSLQVSAGVANLLLLATTCHLASAQANRVGRIVFSPLSPVVKKRDFSQDNLEAATYFQLTKVHFFAAVGLIRIDLPLLLSIASGITTYLVILHAASNG